MILFHTSPVLVDKPDTAHSRDFLDFGKGFYLTDIREQAERYGQRFIRRQKSAWLNSYNFNFEEGRWKILRFDRYDKDWLEFVAKCRAGNDDSDYDIVIGGIANDRVIQTLDRYFEGEISQAQALGLLAFERPNIQYCIRSQQMLDECIIHIESIEL